MEHSAAAVRPCSRADDGWKRDRLEAVWGSTVVARKGEAIDAADLPGFVVEVGGRPRGLSTYRVTDDEVEVVTIQTDDSGSGLGRALMDAVKVEAERLGARRIWLVTTGNNARAIDFYRQWGMRQVAVYPGGVERSRRVKPSIPIVDSDGRPIRDELEFELPLA